MERSSDQHLDTAMFRALAQRGAETRLAELQREIDALNQAFPEIESEARRQRQIAQAAHAREARGRQLATAADPAPAKKKGRRKK